MIVMPVSPNALTKTPPPPTQQAPRLKRSAPALVTTPRIDGAMKQVSTLRDSFRAGLGNLRDLAAKLKIIKTTQRSSEKEVRQLRKVRPVKF